MPVHTVETILLSVISMLSTPNDESPANIEAAVGIYSRLLWNSNVICIVTTNRSMFRSIERMA